MRTPEPPNHSSTRRDPYAAFRFRGFVLYSLGNFIAITGRQMLTVALEWEVYARTHSATALGLVGLMAALPVVALSLPAGHLADRFSRKTIILWSQAASGLCSLCLALISWQHLALPRLADSGADNASSDRSRICLERHAAYHFDDLSLPLLFLVMFLSGSARTFGWAARASFFPTLVPRDYFANAVTWNSSMFQIACVLGPAAAGFLIVRLGFPFIYLLDSAARWPFSSSSCRSEKRARHGASRLARGRVWSPGCASSLAVKSFSPR